MASTGNWKLKKYMDHKEICSASDNFMEELQQNDITSRVIMDTPVYTAKHVSKSFMAEFVRNRLRPRNNFHNSSKSNAANNPTRITALLKSGQKYVRHDENYKRRVHGINLMLCETITRFWTHP